MDVQNRALGMDRSEPPACPIVYPSQEAPSKSFSWVSEIHTLGPQGTNCERAARHWINRFAPEARIVLHQSIERAADEIAVDHCQVMLGVVAYPDLHSIIYTRAKTMRLLDVFIMDTDEMVMAVHSECEAHPRLCATHPAPQALLPSGVERRFVSSTAIAAEQCASGKVEGCITTLAAAQRNNLRILQNYGPIPMGFTIHGSPFKSSAIDVETCCATQR